MSEGRNLFVDVHEESVTLPSSYFSYLIRFSARPFDGSILFGELSLDHVPCSRNRWWI